MCLRGVCVVLEALLARLGMAFLDRMVSLGSPSSVHLLNLAPPPLCRFFPLRFGDLFILLPVGFWIQCDESYIGGMGAGGSWLGCGLVGL